MKLYYSTNSPYVRKVIVLAAETGQAASLEPVPTNTRVADETLASPANELGAVNPLAVIPTLITDDGDSLYDSLVICAYLDSGHVQQRMFPPEGPARWQALRRDALADGMLLAAYLIMIENRRRFDQRVQGWIEHQRGKILRGLDRLDHEAADFGDGHVADIGLISIGCALGFLDYRFPDLDWRRGRNRLARWFTAFDDRPAMAATRPRDP